MGTASRMRWVCVCVALAGSRVVACSSDAVRYFDPCPRPDVVTGFNPETRTEVEFQTRETPWHVQKVSAGATMYLRRRGLPHESAFDMTLYEARSPDYLDSRGPAIDVKLALTSELFTAPVGATLEHVGEAELLIIPKDERSDVPCRAPLMLVTRTTVLAARGSVDPVTLVMDKSFARRFAIEFDWRDLGCGVTGIRGRVELVVASGNLAFNCEDTVRFVGDDPPFPPLDPDAGPDAASDAANGVDGGPDAASDAADGGQ